MSKQHWNFANRGIILFTLLAVLALACSLPAGVPPQTPEVDLTKVHLEFQSTAMSEKLTQQALETEPASMPTQLSTQPAQPTSEQPTATSPAPTEILPTVTLDVAEQMKSAKILLYEDTPYIGLWIRDTLEGMGLKYTFVGDALGDFMENLNSSIQWDLIIVGAEAHEDVSGEFFDVITKRVVQDDTALIAEMWYLDMISEGRIKALTTQCGVELQKNYEVASSIYWLDSSAPVFAEPNIAIPLIHYTPYWEWQAGDYMKLLPGSEAALLAGMYQNRSSDYGVVASCFEGRVILQTFCNHDYKEANIQLLWENYIYNTLRNHFAAVSD